MTDSTHPWFQFLSAQGAQRDANGAVLDFGTAAGVLPQAGTGYLTPLSDLGLIAARGDDAVNFLHNQLTQDVERLDGGHARRAGYCSPKGRLLATMLIWKTQDAVLLQLPLALQPAIQKRLQMFVLRAKVKLSDAGAEQVALGIGGQAAIEALAPWFPQVPATALEKIDTEAGTLIRLPDAFGAPRLMWIAPLERAQQAWPQLSAKLATTPTALWHLADIEAGVAQVTPATQEQFVPQMVNFELVEGVNFKKGCFPGQEVVARTQYLGKLKRRMLPAVIEEGAPAAGMEVFSSTDPDQPCGMIVNVAPRPEGGTAALVEVKLAALDAGTVHLGAVSGPLLRFQPLPYALPE